MDPIAEQSLREAVGELGKLAHTLRDEFGLPPRPQQSVGGNDGTVNGRVRILITDIEAATEELRDVRNEWNRTRTTLGFHDP